MDDIEELLKHFGCAGTFDKVVVNNGTAIVTFSRRANAAKAVEALHGRELDGRPMTADIIGSHIVERSASTRGRGERGARGGRR